MTQGKTGWGIWGTGAIARRFSRDLALRDDATLVAVASRDGNRARMAAAEMGAAGGVEGLEALAARDGIDIVYIATPSHRHFADCLAAIEAGKAVLCEKPLAMTAAEGRQIAAAAQARGVFCMEALWTHFLPAVAEAERLVRAGAIGEVRHVAGSFGHPGAPAGTADALHDRGCYPISLALRFLGAVETVAAAGGEKETSLLLAFAHGRGATITASFSALLDNRLVISGTGGRLTLEDPISAPSVLTLAQVAPAGGREHDRLRGLIRRSRVLTALRFLAGRRPRPVPFRAQGYWHEIEEVQNCLRAGLLESPGHPLSRSIETLAVIDRARAGGR